MFWKVSHTKKTENHKHNALHTIVYIILVCLLFVCLTGGLFQVAQKRDQLAANTTLLAQQLEQLQNSGFVLLPR